MCISQLPKGWQPLIVDTSENMTGWNKLDERSDVGICNQSISLCSPVTSVDIYNSLRDVVNGQPVRYVFWWCQPSAGVPPVVFIVLIHLRPRGQRHIRP